MKKLYSLPEEKFLQKVEDMNKSRGFYMPKDKKAIYKEKRIFDKYQCLVVQNEEKVAKSAILYFFGGGMMLGPDKGDVDVLVKLAKKTGCDIWFPMYPLCTTHCITESYDMVYECYRQMIEIYGGGNVSTCGFSSGGALAIGIAVHNNALGNPLPMPRHIVAVSPGEVPWNDEERQLMQELNPKDVMVDYAYMEKVEKFERQGRADVPEYMIHISKGDLTGVPDIYFCYSEDEVLYGAKDNFVKACEKYHVNYQMKSRKDMIHCYAMLPYFKESKEDFDEIAAFLSR